MLAAVATAGDRLLSVPPSAAFWVAIVLYGGAAIAYLISFVAARPGAAGAARALMVLALIAHGVDIGWRGVEKVHPATSVREALGFLAWIAGGGFLATTWRYRIDLAGVVAAPATLAILAVARLSPAGEEQSGLNALGRIHIMLAVTGVALFAIATVLALLYLLEERSLKKKRFDALTFKNSSAPLEKLDASAHRLILAGFPIFTVAVVLGVVWVSQRGTGFDRPEYPFAIASWLTFAALIITRLVYGWRGRRTARLTLAGFAAALVVLVIYLVRRSAGG
jgi:ABC-type uncharacterized transport system permease subunit